MNLISCHISGHTVYGRNPAPVDRVNITVFTGFHTCWVVQDFFHQQYHVISCQIMSYSCQSCDAEPHGFREARALEPRCSKRPCLSGSLNGTTSKFSDDLDDELDPSDIQ